MLSQWKAARSQATWLSLWVAQITAPPSSRIWTIRVVRVTVATVSLLKTKAQVASTPFLMPSFSIASSWWTRVAMHPAHTTATVNKSWITHRRSNRKSACTQTWRMPKSISRSSIVRLGSRLANLPDLTAVQRSSQRSFPEHSCNKDRIRHQTPACNSFSMPLVLAVNSPLSSNYYIIINSQ